MAPEGNPLVFLDLSVSGEAVGRLVIELFENIVPKTTENFRQLCIGTRSQSGKKLMYKGSHFHKLTRGSFILGGDINSGERAGGESIYGGTFEDENFSLKHEKAGLLSMANDGPNSNGSQFFITTNFCPPFDGQHVVFGQVKKGMGIVYDIEKLDTDEDGKPLQPITIENSGQILHGSENWGICENDGPDVYPFHPDDFEINWHLKQNFDEILKVVENIKMSGNEFYKRGDMREALRKYKKASKYIEALRNSMGSTEDDEEEKIRTVQVPIVLNTSAVHIKLQNYKEGLRLSELVLNEARPSKHSTKALYRRGQARVGLQDLELGIADLKTVLQKDPADKSVVKELNKAMNAYKAYKDRQKKMFAKIFK